MATWLDTIKEELDKIGPDDLIEPTEELGPRDNLVGTVNDHLKKLYSLTLQLKKSADKAQIDAQYARNKNELMGLAKECEKLCQKVIFVMDTFWISLRDAYDLWDKPTIGIRSGWQVVYWEAMPPQSPLMTK